MADQSIEIRTSMTVAQVARVFRDTLVDGNRGVEFGHIRPDDSPFGQFERQPAFTSYAHVESKINHFGQWAIQVYVFDEGEHREVNFVIFGSSAAGRFFRGAKNTFSPRVGREKVDQIINQMRGADRSLRVIG